eukprot:5999770-Prymnesium_polylepis.1
MPQLTTYATARDPRKAHPHTAPEGNDRTVPRCAHAQSRSQSPSVAQLGFAQSPTLDMRGVLYDVTDPLASQFVVTHTPQLMLCALNAQVEPSIGIEAPGVAPDAATADASRTGTTTHGDAGRADASSPTLVVSVPGPLASSPMGTKAAQQQMRLPIAPTSGMTGSFFPPFVLPPRTSKSKGFPPMRRPKDV